MHACHGHTMSMSSYAVGSTKWPHVCPGHSPPICPFVSWNGSFKHMSAPLSASGWNLLTPDLRSDGSKQDYFNGVGVFCYGHGVASLWARLLSLPANCSAAHIVRYAASQPHSWVHLLVSELNSVGVPRPDTCGVHMGCASSQLERWLRQLKRILSDWSNSLYAGTLRKMESLHSYARWQPTPDLNHIVYGQHVPAQSARYWALARCGHHCFSDGRAARHCNASIDHASIPCRFCASASDTLAHALLDCSAHTVLRRRWARKSRHSPISLHKFFKYR